MTGAGEARAPRPRPSPAKAQSSEHRRELLPRLDGPARAAAVLASALAAVASLAVVDAPALGLGSSHVRELARLLNEWKPPRRSAAGGRFRASSRGRRASPP
jgi:hypothetical protein